MGQGGTQAAVGVIIVAWGLLRENRAIRRLGWSAVAAVASSGLGAFALKHLTGRPRPRCMLIWTQVFGSDNTLFNIHIDRFFSDGIWFFGPGLGIHFTSFPSGHAATSFALAVVLTRAWPRWWPLFMGLAGYITAFRVVGGSHFLSDIVAGILWGCLWGWLCSQWLSARPHPTVRSD
jgi:undecaprenyl-diphosphatase